MDFAPRPWLQTFPQLSALSVKEKQKTTKLSRNRYALRASLGAVSAMLNPHRLQIAHCLLLRPAFMVEGRASGFFTKREARDSFTPRRIGWTGRSPMQAKGGSMAARPLICPLSH
jgi:hypothetical protein